jgi:hypothetical protein
MMGGYPNPVVCGSEWFRLILTACLTVQYSISTVVLFFFLFRKAQDV